MAKTSKKATAPTATRAPAKPAAHPRRLSGIRNQYDIAGGVNADGGRMRRPGHVETGSEEEVFRPFQRMKALSLSRDLIRNSGMTRGLDKVLRVNVVGPEGKLKFRENGEWFDKASRWFNVKWSKAVDFIDGSTWRECLQLVVHALSFDGEFVAVFDDGLLSGEKGTGKICFFEADRIAPLCDELFKPYKEKGWMQDGGVLYDGLGRKVGVVISSVPGLSVIGPKVKHFVFTRDPDADPLSASWRHVMRKFRLRQGRGVSDAVTALPTSLDALEILSLEMQSAKAGAAHYATVYQKDDPEDAINALGYIAEQEALRKKGDANGAELPGGEEAAGEEPGPAEEPFYSDALERLTGGNVDYLRQGDKVEVAPTSRPNPNLAAFLDYAGDVAGAAHGLSHSYARLKADTSYTSYRGDMVMTWRTLGDFQQFLEDAFSDWIAYRAISRAIAAGDLTPGPEGWEECIAWQYPSMPAVDEQKEQAALAQKLRNGLTTYREQLGPDWRRKFKDLSEEQDEARKLGLHLPTMETASGAITPAEPNDDKQD